MLVSRELTKNKGIFGIITPGLGGFRSSSLVFWSHKTQHISRPISGLAPFYDAEITKPPPSFAFKTVSMGLGYYPDDRCLL
jgi:hypothetical protein